MAKPKGATLTRLFAVSDAERQAFWADLEGKKRRDGETGTPTSGTPASGTPVTGIAASADLLPQRAVTTEAGIPQTAAPKINAPARQPETEQAVDVPVAHPRRIRQAERAQDGHSLGEQAVYAALWMAGQPTGEDCRRVTIGYRTLSDACGLTVNNCKANLQSLARKLAIEEVAGHTNSQAKTYTVHSYGAILRRRRQAGLTHLIRTKGVIFVNPETGVPVSGIPVPGKGAPKLGTPSRQTGTPAPETSGIPVSGTPIRNRNLLEEKQLQEDLSASSSFPIVVATARRSGVTLDDDAARRLVLRSQTFDESATEDEVAHFIQVKITQLRNSRNVDNPVGLLIKAVPEFFKPPATELQAVREQKAHELDKGREVARAVLADPNTSDADRHWARSVLGQPPPDVGITSE